MSDKIYNFQDVKETNYFNMYQSVVEFMKSNNIKVGDKLPSENILAEKTYINRSSLREALRVLEAFGIIVSKKGSGNVYVCDLEIGLMNLFMIANSLEDTTLTDINKTRALIEAKAIEEFITKGTDYDFFLLEMIYNEQMKAVKDKTTKEYLEYHIMFHDQIMKFTDNKIAKHVVHSGIRLVDNNRIKKFVEESATTKAADHVKRAEIASHENIINAIKSKDIAVARDLITRHILIPGEIIETL